MLDETTFKSYYKGGSRHYSLPMTEPDVEFVVYPSIWAYALESLGAFIPPS